MRSARSLSGKNRGQQPHDFSANLFERLPNTRQPWLQEAGHRAVVETDESQIGADASPEFVCAMQASRCERVAPTNDRGRRFRPVEKLTRRRSARFEGVDSPQPKVARGQAVLAHRAPPPVKPVVANCLVGRRADEPDTAVAEFDQVVDCLRRPCSPVDVHPGTGLAVGPASPLRSPGPTEGDRGCATIGEPPLPLDATPLWICLLVDAWRWGLAAEEVERLIPHLERALAWMRDYGDADGDGFLEYVPHAAQGLSNQGWKDSHDSVQWFDGALAESPIALCEVQGYAHEAARKGADLLEAFDRPGADEWRDWATRLSKRFREAFWVERAGETYPAIALDRNKQRVDTVSSNIGHLLDTGILDDDETAVVAARLGQPDMNSGWGLRTMTAASPRYNPLSYHGGSVWPHDTAITISGLAATGHDDIAVSLAKGLVAAAEAFEFRLPELFGGHARSDGIGPVPYPAACRPQAWAAATAVYVTAGLLGLQPDVPGGRLAIRPVREAPFGELDVEGFMLGEAPIRVRHDPRHDPATTVDGLPANVALQLLGR
jgi:hypothetical protein